MYIPHARIACLDLCILQKTYERNVPCTVACSMPISIPAMCTTLMIIQGCLINVWGKMGGNIRDDWHGCYITAFVPKKRPFFHYVALMTRWHTHTPPYHCQSMQVLQCLELSNALLATSWMVSSPPIQRKAAEKTTRTTPSLSSKISIDIDDNIRNFYRGGTAYLARCDWDHHCV